MTSYKFVSLKDLEDPKSFQSKSVTNITSSEQVHKTVSSGQNEEEYCTKIEKSFSENDITDGKSSSKSEYSFMFSSQPFQHEKTEKTPRDSGMGKSRNTDDTVKFSFLKEDWSYKVPPSHDDGDFKSSYEKIYNDFDKIYERMSSDNDPLQYQSKKYSSNYDHSDYEFNKKNERTSTNEEFSFANSIPSHRTPPSHHDKYDSYEFLPQDDFGNFDKYPSKNSQSSSRSNSSNSKHSESKTEYDKFEEHSEYLYRPEPSTVKHLIQDEIDFSSLMFDDYAHDKSRNIEDFSNYYFQVHHWNPNKYQQTSRESGRKTEASSRSETKRRTKPIVHYMLPETRTPKPSTQTKKPLSASKTAPRTCRRDKYCVENYYDVDTKVVNSNLSSNAIYKERVSSSESKKCSCIPGVKSSKKPIVIYTYTYENDTSKAVIPPKKRGNPLSKRDIVLTAPRPSKSQSLDNLSTVYNTDYLNKRFFDDYQSNKWRRSVSPGYKEAVGSSGYNIPRSTSGSNRSCLVTKENSECVTLSSLGNFVQRQNSREGLQKHVTFSDLVSMQSYSDHEEFT